MPSAARPTDVPVVIPTHWSSLHHAWHEAILASGSDAARPKEPLPINVLIAIVDYRMRADPALRSFPDLAASLHQRIADLQPHRRDAQGRNWDVPARSAAAASENDGENEFRRLVDAMRDQFDLA